jgi:hypothetical protein
VTRLVVLPVLAIVAAVATAGPCLAHAMTVRVTVTADAVVAKVSFDGDDDLRGTVTVKLLDDSGAVIGKAEPGKDGTCTFPRPKPGRYKVLAEDDGFGHRDERPFEVKDGQETTTAAPPDQSRGLTVAVGLGAIGVLTLLGYWLAGRKKADHPA